MPLLRRDLLTDTWITLAPERRGIGAAHAGTLPTLPGPCPFCPGNEAETETTLASIPEEGAWRVRVVRNRYPIVASAGQAVGPETLGEREALAAGTHEVLVESPDHEADLSDFEADHAADVMRMYRDRVRALEALPDTRVVVVFRNRGRRAGSSQPHPHGQIVSLAYVPDGIADRFRIARSHYAMSGHDLLQTLTGETLERRSGDRVVEEDDGYVALCPFAPRHAYETWIVPRARGGSFAHTPDDALLPLARLLVRTLARVRVATRGADYNLLWRSPPVDARGDPASFHYLEIAPRIGGAAGFELTTGVQIVTVAPEVAAAELRASL